MLVSGLVFLRIFDFSCFWCKWLIVSGLWVVLFLVLRSFCAVFVLFFAQCFLLVLF